MRRAGGAVRLVQQPAEAVAGAQAKAPVVLYGTVGDNTELRAAVLDLVLREFDRVEKLCA
jgi:hypothetical protein